MGRSGMKRCRTITLFAFAGLLAATAGCSTVKKTFDTTPDPELQRPGVYPNINDSGKAQPGKPLTADEQAKVQASLESRARQADPATGASAKKEVESQADALGKIASTHADEALQEIKNGCGTAKPVDATKCPQ